MRTDYTKPLHAQVKKSPAKLRVDRKRLFTVFACAFVGFFLVCTLVATLLTPKIDIPALDNEQEVVPSLTSDDFKGRIDPRLKSIEQSEDAPPPIAKEQNQNTDSTQVNGLKTRPQKNMNNMDVEQNVDSVQYKESDPVPYNNNRNSDILMPEDLQYQDYGYSQPRKTVKTQQTQVKKVQIVPKTSSQVQSPVPSSTRGLNLRDKVDVLAPPTPDN